ncbi:MAG TPA: hypothetical protein VNY32_07025, partial [Candidatus Acidoferrales bacterium]|nr:hypothetical protein [Candidatus Acidoferrales bacterium]
AWPEVYKKCADILGEDDPIFLKGRLEVGEERIQIIANEISALAEVAAKARSDRSEKPNGKSDPVHLYVSEAEISADELSRLRDTLLDYPGPSAVFLHVLAASKSETVIELPDQVRVASTPELEAVVEQRFGTRIAFHLLAS